MKLYKLTGDEMIFKFPNVTEDYKGYPISSYDTYFIRVFEGKDGEEDKTIVKKEADYERDRDIMKIMVYMDGGFELLMKSIIGAGIRTFAKQKEVIESMIETMVSTEDYENAGKLRKELTEYEENKTDFVNQIVELVDAISEEKGVKRPLTVPACAKLIMENKDLETAIMLFEGARDESKYDIFKQSAYEATLETILYPLRNNTDE